MIKLIKFGLTGRPYELPKGKILLIAQNFYPEIGSAGNRMKNIYQMLRLEGYEVTVLTNEPSYPNKKLYEDQKFWDEPSLNRDSHINRVKVRNRKYSFNMMNRLFYYLEMTVKMIFFVLSDRTKYTKVFVTSPPIFIGLVGIIAKFRYKVNLILDIRDLWPESLKGVGVFNNRIIIWIAALFETFLYRRADSIIVNSLGFIDYISRKAKIEAKKIAFLPNAATRKELRYEKKRDSPGFRVIYTGNLGLAQDIDFLKELSLGLHKQKVMLHVVGYGMRKKELIQFTKEHHLDNVTFQSPTTRAECLLLNKEYDVGIVSLNDNEVFDTVLPGKIIDYMISGLPIVATVSGYSKKMIEQYEIGFVSENRNLTEIIHCILQLKNNPEMGKKMSRNSFDLINSKFLWDKNIETLLTVLEQEQPSSLPVVAGNKTKVKKV